jgi:hypothetical protein
MKTSHIAALVLLSWTLVISMPRGPAPETKTGFPTKQACEQAAAKWASQFRNASERRNYKNRHGPAPPPGPRNPVDQMCRGYKNSIRESLNTLRQEHGLITVMTKCGFVIVLNVGIFVLLLVLVMEAAGMRRSLRRIEREERALVHGQANTNQKFRGPTFTDSSADSLWLNATDGAWILVPSGPCSDCRGGPFYHRFFTKEGCEGALAEWNAALNEQRVRQATGPISAYLIGVPGNCEAHPLRP